MAKSVPDEMEERILQAASRVFSSQGFAGATTRAIAAEAGVNEVTLFRRFGSKKNLMMAVIDRFSALRGLEAALEGQLTGDYRQDLQRIGTLYLETMDRNRKVILLMLCEAQRLPEAREVVAAVPLLQRRLLADYLRQQMARGVVRDLEDVELMAQAFFGMMFEYAISRTFLPAALQSAGSEDVVARMVDLFVDGTIAKGKRVRE